MGIDICPKCQYLVEHSINSIYENFDDREHLAPISTIEQDTYLQITWNKNFLNLSKALEYNLYHRDIQIHSNDKKITRLFPYMSTQDWS